MSNMSYCRFQNTLQYLRDCHDAWDEPIDSEEEIAAREALAKLCRKIAQEVFE